MPWLISYPREKIKWHPIIDYDRCTACGVCLSCGMGVFRWSDDRPRVVRPNDCVIDCTTCAYLLRGVGHILPRHRRGTKDLQGKQSLGEDQAGIEGGGETIDIEMLEKWIKT
ncbi:MAG: ferredoxin family protein [Candidatus Bipolaricaulia bacterium]